MWNCPKCGASTPKTCTCAKEVPPMTAPDLDALARLLGAATPGPWQVHREDVPYTAPVGGDCIERTIHTAYDHPQLGGPAPVVTQSFGLIARPVVSVSDADAHLIAAAVNALPALLATAQRERWLREALEWAKAGIVHQRTHRPGALPELLTAEKAIDAALAEEGQDGSGMA